MRKPDITSQNFCNSVLDRPLAACRHGHPERHYFCRPADVVRPLSLLLPSAEFWISIIHSFGKITLGFAAAFIAGILLGSLAFRFHLLRELLEPLMLLGQIHSCGLLCHSGPHPDWLLRSFCVHFLPGRISHSLCKYHCRTGKHGF